MEWNAAIQEAISKCQARKAIYETKALKRDDEKYSFAAEAIDYLMFEIGQLYREPMGEK